MEYLPPDAKAGPLTVWRTGSDSCGVLNITSNTLASEFAKAGQAPANGHPANEIGVELGYVDTALNRVYDPNNVEDAMVSPLSINLTGTPSC